MLKKSLFWLLSFLAYCLVIIALGAFLGAFLSPIVGHFTHPELGVIQLMENGLSLGTRFASVWAGGLAIVLCFMQGYRTQRKQKPPRKTF
ncbi:MAG TPA: hypothetical protein DIU37_01720 [Opitutae bacterium]|nr:hypothetical protein [Opitutae bacterium]